MAIDYVASALGTDRGPKSKLPDGAGHLLYSLIISPRGQPTGSEPRAARFLWQFKSSIITIKLEGNKV